MLLLIKVIASRARKCCKALHILYMSSAITKSVKHQQDIIYVTGSAKTGHNHIFFEFLFIKCL